MAITIDDVPEFITREDYLALMATFGFDPNGIQELRFAHDGIHAIAFYRDRDGRRVLDRGRGGGYYKHRVFIPVRDEEDDTRTTRNYPVKDNSRD